MDGCWLVFVANQPNRNPAAGSAQTRWERTASISKKHRKNRSLNLPATGLFEIKNAEHCCFLLIN
jgi:hypothetical protein